MFVEFNTFFDKIAVNPAQVIEVQAVKQVSREDGRRIEAKLTYGKGHHRYVIPPTHIADTLENVHDWVVDKLNGLVGVP